MGEPLTDRLFLGVALTDELRHGLAAFLEAKAAPLPGKPVPPANWHLTLRFLGATEEPDRDRVLAFLDEDALTLPFVLGFGPLGAFSRPARATVLWMGVRRGAEELAELRESQSARIKPGIALGMGKIRRRERVTTITWVDIERE